MSDDSVTVDTRFSQAHRKAIAALFPEMAKDLWLDSPKKRQVLLTREKLQEIRDKAQETLASGSKTVAADILRGLIEAANQLIELSQNVAFAPTGERVYQFKITLLKSRPTIWRRILISDCTLDELHDYIQTAMGWDNEHLYEFNVNNVRYCHPRIGANQMVFRESDRAKDSTRISLTQILPRGGKKFSFYYEYDFGDSWGHEITFEKYLRIEADQEYPICLEGKGACPPEDCGGIWHYNELAARMAERMTKAVGDEGQDDEEEGWFEPFDPNQFDAAEATERMNRGSCTPPYLQQWGPVEPSPEDTNAGVTKDE